MLSIENVIEDADIFKGLAVTYKLLDGGFVNRIYKVECDGKEYCVRINNSRQAEFFRLDTVKEAQAIQQASMFSIAPKIYNIDNSNEYLITDYFPGRLLSTDDARNPEIMKKYVGAIKLIHDNVKVDRIFSIYDQFDKYIETAKICGMQLPVGLGKVMAQVEKIKKMRSNSKLLYKVFSHNDIWQNNILYDGNNICIIDWEYCGYGDGFFDFAHIANSTGMTVEEQQFMLKTYFGYYEPEMWQMLRQMKFISDAYCAIWYIFHSCIADDPETKSQYTETAHNSVNGLADSIK